VKFGMSPMDASSQHDKGGRSAGHERRTRRYRAGRVCGLIAVARRPAGKIDALKNTFFVMKDGEVYKCNRTNPGRSQADENTGSSSVAMAVGAHPVGIMFLFFASTN